MAEYDNLVGFVDKDGNAVSCPALKYIAITDSGNVQITTDSGAKLNIEAGDNEAHKPVGKIQLDTNHFETDGDKDEFKIAVICDKKSKVEGLKMECAGLKFVTADADTARGWLADTFKMLFKRTTGTTDTWSKLNMHAASIDLRTRSTGAGTGGGIAVQISSCDSNYKENKFKIETDRIIAPSDTDATSATYGTTYAGEGGKGIEIVTINSKFNSQYSNSYRFKADAPIYAVTRGALVTDPDSGKVDFPTQSDDSKDIINDESPITWSELVAAVKKLKGVDLDEVIENASNAIEKATNAETSASNAETSASNAATSASNAQTSASNAATSASNAEASAETAATQAANSATSASAAATSASNAETYLSDLKTAIEALPDGTAVSEKVAEHTVQLDEIGLKVNELVQLDDSSAQFNIGDEDGNVIAQFKDGNIATKNFDSSKDATTTERGLMSANDKETLNNVATDIEKSAKCVNDSSNAQFNIGDEDGNVIVQFKDGNISTKKFKSIEATLVSPDDSEAEFNIGDEDGNVIVQFKDGNIKTKNFDSSLTDNYILSDSEKEMLDDARAKVVELNKSNKFLNFAYITDTHADGLYNYSRNAANSLKLFKAFCNEGFMDFAAHGGDLITDYCEKRDDAIKSFDSVTSYTGEIKCPVYFAKGNHDSSGKYFERADMENLDWSNTYYAPYYASDLGKVGIKVVTESTWDGKTELFTSNVADANELMSNQQFFMLTENSIDVVHDTNNKFAGYFYKDFDDYNVRIVVVNAYEIPTQTSGTGNTNWDGAGVSSLQKTWLKNTALATTKNVIILGHPNGAGGLSSLFPTVEESGGKLIAYIHGHDHYDSFDASDGYCNIGVTKAFGIGIEKYYALSVFTVDTDNGMLYETRIGDGTDRKFDYINIKQD